MVETILRVIQVQSGSHQSLDVFAGDSKEAVRESQTSKRDCDELGRIIVLQNSVIWQLSNLQSDRIRSEGNPFSKNLTGFHGSPNFKLLLWDAEPPLVLIRRGSFEQDGLHGDILEGSSWALI